MDEYDKLKSLGFDLDKLTSREIEDLKKCIISISENEDLVSYQSEKESLYKKNIHQSDQISEINDMVKNTLESVPVKVIHTNTTKPNKTENTEVKDYKFKEIPAEKFKEYTFSKEKEKQKTKQSQIKAKNNYSTNKPKSSTLNNMKQNTNKVNEFGTFDFNKLIIDFEEYMLCKSKLSKDLTPSQLYSMKVYEKFDLLQKELNEYKSNYFQVRQDFMITKEEVSMLKLEKEKLTQINNSNNEILNMKIVSLELENMKLKELSNNHEKKINDYTPKAQKYEELILNFTRVDKELKDSHEQINKLTFMNNSLLSEMNDLKVKLDQKGYETESLQRDKQYLNKEILIKDEKILQLSNKLSSQDQEISEIRKTNHKYIEKLTDKSSIIESEYQNKLKAEILEIKEKYNKDLDNIKKMYEDLNSTKTQFLIEERNELKIKVSQLEASIKIKSESLEFISNEFRNFKISTNEEISCLKITHKIKCDDYDRLSNLYQETNLNLNTYKEELEILKEKNDILRKEILSREVQYKEEVFTLKAEVAILKENKSQYEKMEDELDKVIVDSSVNDL